MTKETFKVSVDSTGREYVFQDIDELDKNHRLDSDLTSYVTDGRMYEIKGHPRCPVSCYKKYLSKLNPDNNSLWQRPVDSFQSSDGIWYAKQPIGKNTLSKMLPNICKQAGIRNVYKNHSLRATNITVLDVNNFSSRDIMSVSGHKSESSLKSYTGKVGTKRKHEMSQALSAALVETSETKIVECTTNCDGILDLSPDQVEALFDNSFQNEKEKENVSLSANVPSCSQNPFSLERFTPYITGCVVNFNINNSK
ncbi:uncharacterized protein LOC134234038 [Saccostrea cucullata]|uniref:uncharacterized protein LOC134234038 n=1 Tax=Saccostrea cuccullata TaxID=36930 RepID=UPI002ED0377D